MADKKSSVGSWDVCCDGWYVYCTNCNYELHRSIVMPLVNENKDLPSICPKCKCKIKNPNLFKN